MSTHTRPYYEKGRWFNLPLEIDSDSFIDFLQIKDKPIIFYYDEKMDWFNIVTKYRTIKKDSFNRPAIVKIKGKKYTVRWDVVTPKELYKDGKNIVTLSCVIFSNQDSYARKISICNTINSIWGLGIWFSYFLDEQPPSDICQQFNEKLKQDLLQVKLEEEGK